MDPFLLTDSLSVSLSLSPPAPLFPWTGFVSHFQPSNPLGSSLLSLSRPCSLGLNQASYQHTSWTIDLSPTGSNAVLMLWNTSYLSGNTLQTHSSALALSLPLHLNWRKLRYVYSSSKHTLISSNSSWVHCILWTNLVGLTFSLLLMCNSLFKFPLCFSSAVPPFN